MIKSLSALSAVVFLLVIFSLEGCNPKAFVKPRSQIIDEALESGVPIPSVEEDRILFFSEEKTQKERLFDLLKIRASGSFRDANYRIGAGDEIELNVFDVHL